MKYILYFDPARAVSSAFVGVLHQQTANASSGKKVPVSVTGACL
ncbi:hypothetical protein [uncultured Roseivirga sp.]|tara:strand:- start:1544 stop:1675 length:132 start_codon:yes stop_codon:yes gene_type:complete